MNPKLLSVTCKIGVDTFRQFYRCSFPDEFVFFSNMWVQNVEKLNLRIVRGRFDKRKIMEVKIRVTPSLTLKLMKV